MQLSAVINKLQSCFQLVKQCPIIFSQHPLTLICLGTYFITQFLNTITTTLKHFTLGYSGRICRVPSQTLKKELLMHLPLS